MKPTEYKYMENSNTTTTTTIKKKNCSENYTNLDKNPKPKKWPRKSAKSCLNGVYHDYVGANNSTRISMSISISINILALHDYKHVFVINTSKQTLQILMPTVIIDQKPIASK